MASSPSKPLFDQVLALILAGGRGDRLLPLTRERTKAAVPFGGVFRLIDFTLANCIHTGLRRMAVLPQYRFASLENHLRENWGFFRPELGQSLALIPPQQRVNGDWYKGTADAVFQNIYTIQHEDPKHTLILSSDHIYRMNYRNLLRAHAESGADLTIACVEVGLKDAYRFGILEVDHRGTVVAFKEKPFDVDVLGIPTRPECALASIGVYVFDTKKMIEVLKRDADNRESRHDFGFDIIPHMIAEGRQVAAYDLQEEENCFWRDIGTIDSYWETTMKLLSPDSPLDLFDGKWPIPACERSLPVQLANGGYVSWVCPGASVADAHICRSVLSPGVTVARGAEVVDSVLMNRVQVGLGASIHRAVVDKGVHIPAGHCIAPDQVKDGGPLFATSGGVVVVPKGTDLSGSPPTREITPTFFDTSPLGSPILKKTAS